MHELETYKLQIYIIFYYIYVLILVEKQKEQPKRRMEEPGKGEEAIEARKGMGQGNDGGKEDSETPATTTTTSSSAAPTITATSTAASGSPPPCCLSAPTSAHGEYWEWVVDKVAEKAATEEKGSLLMLGQNISASLCVTSPNSSAVLQAAIRSGINKVIIIYLIIQQPNTNRIYIQLSKYTVQLTTIGN